jgi:hypothetical protein
LDRRLGGPQSSLDLVVEKRNIPAIAGEIIIRLFYFPVLHGIVLLGYLHNTETNK